MSLLLLFNQGDAGPGPDPTPEAVFVGGGGLDPNSYSNRLRRKKFARKINSFDLLQDLIEEAEELEEIVELKQVEKSRSAADWTFSKFIPPKVEGTTEVPRFTFKEPSAPETPVEAIIIVRSDTEIAPSDKIAEEAEAKSKRDRLIIALLLAL